MTLLKMLAQYPMWVLSFGKSDPNYFLGVYLKVTTIQIDHISTSTVSSISEHFLFYQQPVALNYAHIYPVTCSFVNYPFKSSPHILK